MNASDTFRFRVWDGFGFLQELIHQWSPIECSNEKDYENSLVQHLRNRLDEVEITPQYGLGRAKADICIAHKFLVDMKTNFVTTGEYQRLLGQLLDYIASDKRVIIVLTGETDPDLKMRLETFIKNENNKFEHFYNGDKIVLLVKNL